jgi:hypothetical protein
MPGRPDLGRQQSAGSADAQKSPLGDEDGSVREYILYSFQA